GDPVEGLAPGEDGSDQARAELFVFGDAADVLVVAGCGVSAAGLAGGVIDTHGSWLLSLVLRQYPLPRSFKSRVESIAHTFRVHEVDAGPFMLGNFLHVTLAAARQDHDLDPRTRRRERLLLDSADRKVLPGEGHFPGHRDVVADRPPGDQGDESHGHGDTR